MYDPVIGRFTSVDPLAETTPSWNPYNYVQNTPINAIDPDGRSCVGCGSNGESFHPPMRDGHPQYIGSNAMWPPEGGSKGDTHSDGDGNFRHDGNGWIDKKYNSYVLPEFTVTPQTKSSSGSSNIVVPDKVGHFLQVGSSIVSGTGAGSSAFGYNLVNNGTYRGVSGSYYPYAGRQGWNQYTGTKAHMNSTLSARRKTTRITRGAGVLNAGINIVNLRTGRITPTQFGIEIGSTFMGTALPAPISVPWTVGYEGLGRWGVGRTTVYKNKIRPWVRRNVWNIKD